MSAGLNELDVEGDWLVTRQVLWMVPHQVLDKALTLKEDRKAESSTRTNRSWSLTDTSPQQRGEVSERKKRELIHVNMCVRVCVQMIVFDLDACAADALKGDTIVCSEYKVRIPLHHLVPDLLLTDLPPQLKIDSSQFEFNPKVRAGRVESLGGGFSDVSL